MVEIKKFIKIGSDPKIIDLNKYIDIPKDYNETGLCELIKVVMDTDTESFVKYIEDAVKHITINKMHYNDEKSLLYHAIVLITMDYPIKKLTVSDNSTVDYALSELVACQSPDKYYIVKVKANFESLYPAYIMYHKGILYVTQEMINNIMIENAMNKSGVYALIDILSRKCEWVLMIN